MQEKRHRWGGVAQLSHGSDFCAGFSLKSQTNELLAVVFELVNGLVHIGQRGVALLLFEG
jgi:hypothetical protein